MAFREISKPLSNIGSHSSEKGQLQVLLSSHLHNQQPLEMSHDVYKGLYRELPLCRYETVFFGGGGVGSQYQSHGGGSCASSIYCSIQTTFKCTKKRVAVCHCCPPCVQYMHKVGPNTPMLFRCYVRYMSPTRGLGLGLHCLLTCTGGSGPKLAIHLAVQPM